MSSGTLSQKRILRNLEERYAAGKLNVNALDSNGLSLVHQFSYDGQMTGLQWTLQHGGSPTARSSEGCVAAHYAAAGGHLHILQHLQEHTTKCIDLKDSNGTYPLYIAAQEGQLDCLMWLTKYSNLSASEPSSDGMTPVHAAAQEGHLDCLRYLIQFARCSATQMDFTGCTPIHFASAEGHWKIVRWLLEHGGVQGDEVDKTGTAAIHLAAEYDKVKVLKVFVKLRNALVNQLDGNGRSPIDICIEKGHKECAGFLNTWQKQSPDGDRRIRHKTSLKKVRFDESNDADLSASESSPRTNNNNAEYTIENGYMIIPGGESEERLKERMKKNREEWQKSNILDIDFDDKASKEDSKQESHGLKGSRNVRKRSSFKDKNAKYQARARTANRGSIGHLLDKLNLKKGLTQEATTHSLPYRSTERGTRPDLIQSVMEADKNAGRTFTRRPSLEFFQDLRSQLNSGRKEPTTRTQNGSDVPVTIFHNGALRSSRDNLSSLEPMDSVDVIEKENRTTGSSDAPDTVNTGSNQSIVEKTRQPVIIDGGERLEKRKDDKTNEKDSQGKLANRWSHQPHPQKKIKLPKGFIGILPKQRPLEQKIEKSRKDKENNNTKKWTFGKSKQKGNIDEGYSAVNNAVLQGDMKEHYLIRTLPLPSHGSHGGPRPGAAAFFSNNLVRDYRESPSKWSSVRESVGSFFSSLRSGKREKVYKVQSVSDMVNPNSSVFQRKESGKFNLLKSIQMKTKKRKSISLEHLPYYSASGEEIKVPNSTQSRASEKRLSSLQPGYTEPDISKLTSMALDQTLKGRVETTEQVEEEEPQPPKPEESLDFVVSSKTTTGFELNSLKINNTTDGMETGKALMW